MSDEEFFTLIELLGVDEACDLLLETTISDIFIEHLLETEYFNTDPFGCKTI